MDRQLPATPAGLRAAWARSTAEAARGCASVASRCAAAVRAVCAASVVTRPGKVVHGVTRLVLEPRTHPKVVPSQVWVSMLQKGDTVVFRIDGQAAWGA